LVPHIEPVADRFAEAGFVALAPDLDHGEQTKSPDQAATLMRSRVFNDTRPEVHDPSAPSDAWAKPLAFLRRVLKD
jgi:dienelactone hydrolase